MSEKVAVAREPGALARFVCWLFSDDAGPGARRWGPVPIRLIIGAMFAASGMQKAFGWFGGNGFHGTVEWIRSSLGFPAPGLFAVLLILTELLGGLMVFLGAGTRLGASAQAIAMVVALVTMGPKGGYFKTLTPQAVLAGCLCLVISGGGALCLSRLWSRRQGTSASPE
jgi:putative oxidoreductase